MTWLEIISIRTAGINEARKVLKICSQILGSISVEKLLKGTVFSNVRYATDISIHLHWKTNPGYGSILGSEVSSAIEDLGLINHSLWVEQEEAVTGAASEPASSKAASGMATPCR